MNWNELVSYSIDASLKSLDKQIYQHIDNKLKSLGFRSLDQQNKDRKLFHFSVVPNDMTKRNDHIKSDIIFALGEKNMELFTPSSQEDRSSQKFVFYDEKEFSELLSLVQLRKDQLVKKETQYLLEQGHTLLKKVTRPQYLKKFNESDLDLDLLEEAEANLFQALSLDEINEQLKILSKSLKRNYSLMPAQKVFSSQFKKILPLEESFEHWYFVIHDDEVQLLDLFLFRTVVSSSLRFSMKRTGSDILNELEQIFSKFEIPIAIFDKDQHLVLHNAAFINLNVSAKKVLGLKVNDQLTINQEVYKVQKLFINDGEFIHVNFIPVREFLGQSGRPSTEELGIVSSSIAHELNNPLGGILAALNVIELDVHEQQTTERINQMREGLKRCQKLVQTFLGFSKIQTTTYDKQLSVQDSFEQAMDLIRFRLIENNIVFSSEYFEKEKFQVEFNPYILSMIFYLYLGEIITNYSHQKLVSQKQSPKINLNFTESKNTLVLELVDDIKISSQFLQSKLITHLLETQRLQLIHDQKKCTFIYKETDGK